MAETTKEKKKVTKRSDEELKKTLNGKITIIVSTALGLANQNDRAGLTSIDKKDDEGKKQFTSAMALVTGPKGTIAGLKEADANMVSLRAAATKALPDIQKGAYSKNVVDLLNFCLTTLAVKEKKKRGFDPSRLDGIVL